MNFKDVGYDSEVNYSESSDHEMCSMDEMEHNKSK
jgi:hypothetical protein